MTTTDDAPAPPDDGLVGVTVDGVAFRAPKGELLIKGAQDHGIHIPRFCWHERMKPVGMCRQCLVQVDGVRGLPPAWIGVGACDLFHDEDISYAHRLKDAGVSCMLEIVEGAFHGFDLIAAKTKIASEFRRSYFQALGNALALQPVAD